MENFETGGSYIRMQLTGRDAALFTNDEGRIVQTEKTEITFDLASADCRIVLQLEKPAGRRPRSLFLTFPTVMNSYSSLPLRLDEEHPLNRVESGNCLVMKPADAETQKVLLERYSATLSALFEVVGETAVGA